MQSNDGTGDGNDQFYKARGVTIDSSEDGNVFVVDHGNHRVQVLHGSACS